MAWEHLKAGKGESSAGSDKAGHNDPWLEKLAPVVADFLLTARWDDGKERETSSLTIVVQDGLWKLCLSDRDASKKLWASGETLTKALKNLEERVTDPKPDWRVDRWRQTRERPSKGR